MPEYRVHQYNVADPAAVCTLNSTGDPVASGLGPMSANYACEAGKMRSTTMWLGIWGGVIIIMLMYYNIKASIMYGVLFVTIISWIPGTSVSYLTDATPGGEERFNYFKQVVALPNPSKTAMALDFGAMVTSVDAWIALITFLYLDFLDATGCLFTMARLINDNVPNFIDDKARFPRRLITLCVDGVAILIGSLLGTSPLTVVAESSVGIKEGGRTGVTAFALGMGFCIAMFFSPLFSAIPGYATGPALVVVGTLMMGEARHIDWDNLKVAFPSFLTIVLMPLTYSIAYGVLTGILANITLWLLCGISDMTIAALGKDRFQRTPAQIFTKMFAVWGEAFEDFVPGVKAEWKGVFSNTIVLPEKVGETRSPKEMEQIERLARSNGKFREPHLEDALAGGSELRMASMMSGKPIEKTASEIYK
jgi:adenine/guanine/hypoxanthine permease